MSVIGVYINCFTQDTCAHLHVKLWSMPDPEIGGHLHVDSWSRKFQYVTSVAPDVACVTLDMYKKVVRAAVLPYISVQASPHHR
jgi:hypothetical protein